MTDKEKIRKEVGRLMTELIQEKEKGFGSDIDDACILELQNVLTYIDSLQEESKFKVGQYLKQGDTIVKILEVSDDGYHCDNAFVPFTAQDSWKLVEDPVSEDLEKVADQYSQGIESDYTNDMFDRGDIYEAVIYGAQWQKQQMMKRYKVTLSLVL